jgi:hypothetical protein
MIPRMGVGSAIALRAALVSALACLACATTRAPAASETARDRPNVIASSAGDPLARLQRTSACWGHCPVYTVEIDSDGNLTYRGDDNVLTRGRANGRLSAEEMSSLREALERWRQLKFVAETGGLCSCTTDSPAVELTTWEAAAPHTARYSDGCAHVPLPLLDLAQVIDRVAEQWSGTRAQRDACFVEERDCSGLVGWPEVSP